MADSPYTVWRGTALEYKSLHKRIGRRFGRPQGCQRCPRVSGTRFDWANVSGNYNEFDRSDWLRLCRFCHMALDKDNFTGKRFSGKQHTEESRSKISAAMKRRWQEDREKRMLSIQKMVETKLKRHTT